MDKKSSRIRRSRRTRAKIAELGANRLSVHRTPASHLRTGIFQRDWKRGCFGIYPERRS